MPPLTHQVFLGTFPLLLLLGGCETPSSASAPTPIPPPATRKWESPVTPRPDGSSLRTAIYYGPWQCTQAFMDDCRAKCTSQAHTLMGCIWLADIKMDWEGGGIVPVAGGTRLAVTHCCCDYPKLTPAENAAQRKKWENAKDSLRGKWGQRFGEWPTEPDGSNWDGHHLHDLWHGGDPKDLDNILPIPSGTHSTFTKAYDMCYAGKGNWNMIGPSRPYAD